MIHSILSSNQLLIPKQYFMLTAFFFLAFFSFYLVLASGCKFTTNKTFVVFGVCVYVYICMYIFVYIGSHMYVYL